MKPIIAVFLGLFLLGPTIARAEEPARPAAPERYDVRIRYQIDAFRNEHIIQFKGMIRFLEKLGLEKDPGPEDEAENPEFNRLTGHIPSKNARRILGERHVKAILLIPAVGKLPEAKTPVRVQVEILGGLPVDRQQVLYAKVIKDLEAQGFQEAVAYDHRGFTRLAGMIPAGKLDGLLEAPPKSTGDKADFTLASTRHPIQVIEVMLGWPATASRPEPPLVPKGQEKIMPELRALLASADASAKVRRLEVILTTTPPADDSGWKRLLTDSVGGLVIEGRLGSIVTVLAKPSETLTLASLPQVDTLRLPRSGELPPLNAGPSEESQKKLLEEVGLERLHQLGHKGKGIRVGIVDGDFRGWEQLIGKKLPKETQYIDMTALRRVDVQPEGFAAAGADSLGNGCVTALATMAAAPEASLTLIRIDPEAPHQLYEVAQHINGDSVKSDTMDRLTEALAANDKSLEARRIDLVQERQRVFESFTGDEESIKRRDALLKKQAQLENDEKAQKDAEIRFVVLNRHLAGLKGIKVVANTVVWNEGYPIVGSSALTRFLDDRPFKAALWLQASGAAKGQVWEGNFQDSDQNGVMEFAASTSRLPPGSWTREINFLGSKSATGAIVPEIPAKSRFRVSIQWREPHDPDYWNLKEDYYRKPLVNPRLVLLRQLDPAGTKQPADDMVVVAQSFGWPARLVNLPNSGIFEQTVEIETREAGRYAVRVEWPGGIPSGIRPAGVPSLPALAKSWELRPRIFVDALGSASKAVFTTFTPAKVSPGTPGDAQAAITIEPHTKEDMAAEAGITNLAPLKRKPNAYLKDPFAGVEGAGQEGPALGFVAGLAAAARSAGASLVHFPESLGVRDAELILPNTDVSHP